MNEDVLKGLLKGEFSSLNISYNDHACNYCDVTQAVLDGLYDYVEWASEKEKRAAMENNSAWTIQWYPDTPVGFYAVGASTLQACLEAATAPSQGVEG